MEGFPVLRLSALGYFPGLPTRWNTLVSEILTLNPLKEMKADLDETIENLNEGIKVEVFAESPRSETGSASADASGNGKLLP